MSAKLQFAPDGYPFQSGRAADWIGPERRLRSRGWRWIGVDESASGWSVGSGFVLAVIWGALWLGHAYDRSLARLNESFSQAFAVAGRLDAIAGALDRLNVDQQAFLSSGDHRFLEGVWESTPSLDDDIAWLSDLTTQSGLPPAPLTSMSHAIKEVLDSVGDSYYLRDLRGRAAARAFFAAKESAIAAAKSQADALRTEFMARIAGRIGRA